MNRCITLYFLLLLSLSARSQDNWDVYLARYDEGPGSVTLDLNLIKTAPVKALPFVLITGVKFTACDKEGFPQGNEFENLYKIADDILKVVSSATSIREAGTFTYQCQWLTYIYVKDTSNLRNLLMKLYKENYGKYVPYLNLRPDPTWDAYLQFLYPNEDILEQMQNQKMLNKLLDAGDNLKKPRVVDHWIYFPTTASRDLYIKFAQQQKFKIVSKAKGKNPDMPYELRISRIDKVDAASINETTKYLKIKAVEYQGQYDGWETQVIRE